MVGIFMLFLPAVMVSARYGGLGPGLFATILSALSIDYFLLSALVRLTPGWGNISQLAVFVQVAVLISSLNEARNRAERRLRESEARDITERKRNEEALRALSESLKKSDELKSAFAALSGLHNRATALVWGWPSLAGLSRRTAEESGWRVRPTRARPSASSFRSSTAKMNLRFEI
jgi:K+-sensing histidine kinase KdpD